jgi:hypothetical protein
MSKQGLRIRGVYAKPWSKMVGRVKLDRKTLERVGEIIVENVVKEAKKDLAKQGNRVTPRGKPYGIPTSRRFFASFDYKIRGERTIEVVSTWPWIELHTQGKEPYRMTWLTRPAPLFGGSRRGGRVPMMQPDGTVLVRMMPTGTANAWIHPGFARHNFLERGVKKGREEAAEIIREEIVAMLANGDPFK